MHLTDIYSAIYQLSKINKYNILFGYKWSQLSLPSLSDLCFYFVGIQFLYQHAISLNICFENNLLPLLAEFALSWCIIQSFTTSGVTDEWGANAPCQLRCGLFFRNGPPLIRPPLLPKQFYKLETFTLYKFFFCNCSSVL